MPEPVKTLSFNLPAEGQVKVYLVKLADGRTVARTAEELAALPANLRGEIISEQPK